MGRGRPKKHDTPVNWYVSVPQSLAAEVELILLDPLTGKPEFGKRSQLVEMLLRDWVERMRLTSGADSAIILEPNGKHHSDSNPGTESAGTSVHSDERGGTDRPAPAGPSEGTGDGRGTQTGAGDNG